MGSIAYKPIKVFISQPMSGLTNEEILKKRELAKRVILKRFSNEPGGVEFIDNFAKPEEIRSNRVKMLGHSIMLLGDADFCYFVQGWEDAPGCCVEFEVCKQYGIHTNVLKRYPYLSKDCEHSDTNANRSE